MAEIMSDTFIWPQSRPWTDFTILFEQSILGILPTGLLVAAAPLYIYVASRESVKSRSGNLLWVKLVSVFSFSFFVFSLCCRQPAVELTCVAGCSRLPCSFRACQSSFLLEISNDED